MLAGQIDMSQQESVSSQCSSNNNKKTRRAALGKDGKVDQGHTSWTGESERGGRSTLVERAGLESITSPQAMPLWAV